MRKRGSGFDLALACACLAAFDSLPREPLAGLVLIGELGLDGTVRPVRGILPMVLAAVEAGFRQFMVADGSGREAALVPGAEVTVVSSLAEAVGVLRGAEPGRSPVTETATADPDLGPDLCDVSGQATPRLAVEVAAAGGHHVFLHGAPGAGKTLLAERLPGLLPTLDPEASLEVTAVHSVAGELNPESPMVIRPPFQAPHHTATPAALVGGGTGVARPGAASLAHRGVLFLDEAPEFSVRALETLRQPMEKGAVFLARSESRVRYPARFPAGHGGKPMSVWPFHRARDRLHMHTASKDALLGAVVRAVDGPSRPQGAGPSGFSRRLARWSWRRTVCTRAGASVGGTIDGDRQIC